MGQWPEQGNRITFPACVLDHGIGLVTQESVRTAHEDVRSITGLRQVSRFEDASPELIAT